MTWGLQQRDFPILAPEQMNPFHQALSQGLKTYGDITKTAYLQPKLQADILSKAAYAAYTPASYVGKVLSDPVAFADLKQNHPEKLQQLLSVFTNIPANPIEALNQQFKQQPGRTGGFWDWAKGLISGEPSQQQVSPQTGQVQRPIESVQENQQPPMSYQQAYDVVQNRPDNVAAQQYQATAPVQPATTPTTQEDLTQAATAARLPLSQAATTLKSQQGASVKGAEKSAQIQSQESQKLFNETFNEAGTSNRLLLNLDTFKNAYDNAWIKGPALNIPVVEFISKFDPNAAKAVNAANNAAVEVASQLFGNKQSDYRERLAQSLKLDVKMGKDTVNEIYEKNVAMAKRNLMHQGFNEYLTSQGITDPNKKRSLWYEYNTDVPMYDIKREKALIQNLTPESYQNYLNNKLSQGNVQSSSSSSRQSAPVKNAQAGWPLNEPAVNADKLQGQMPPPGTRWMIRPDGMQVPVLDSRKNEAYELNYRDINL